MSRDMFKRTLKLKLVDDSTVENQTDLAFICIHNPDDGPDEKPYFYEDHDNVLNVWFYDVDEPVAEGDKIFAPISAEQAESIYAFVKRHKDKKGILIHCTAGVARSGAVAAFIHDFTTRGGGDWEAFKRDNPSILPNPTVYRLLHDAWYADQSQF